jgi:hypothetical protein
VCPGCRFGFDGGKELCRHHLNRALKHPLSNPCYCTADLYVSLVADNGYVVSLFEIDITKLTTTALQEMNMPARTVVTSPARSIRAAMLSVIAAASGGLPG